MHVWKRLAILSLALSLGACEGHSENTTSAVQFSLLGNEAAGLLAHVKEPSIKICLNGDTPDGKWQKWTVDSVMKWIAPLRAISSDDLADQVDIVTTQAACANAHALVTVYPQNFRAQTYVGTFPEVQVSEQDTRNGLVILHELGHAFSLGDTYNTPDTASQPDSVMKTARFYRLQNDDIQAIITAYRGYYGNETAKQTSKIFMAIEDAANGTPVKLYFAGEKPLANVRYCVGQNNFCAETDPKWQVAVDAEGTDKAALFATASSLDLKDPTYLSVDGQLASDKTKVSARFKLTRGNAPAIAASHVPTSTTASYSKAAFGDLLNGDFVHAH